MGALLRLGLVALALAALTAGCDGTGGPPDGAIEAGMDARVIPDECAASTIEAAETVGCNGPLIGPNPPEATPDAPCEDDRGCFGGGRCERDPLGRLRCVYPCPPAPTYVSTGGCPIGSRCLTLGREEGRCFRDCLSDLDCGRFSRCDLEGSCVVLDLDGGPMLDGGPRDAAAGDAATGSPDGGLGGTDAGT